MPQAESLVLADPEVITPPGQSLWTTPEMFDPDRKRPAYTMATVAQVFFMKSTPWLRAHIRPRTFKGKPIFDDSGQRVLHTRSSEYGVVEPPRTGAGHHLWRLYDIERLAYAFHEHHVITTVELENCIRMVKLQAKMAGYLS